MQQLKYFLKRRKEYEKRKEKNKMGSSFGQF